MNITYMENPLATKIELDDNEKKELWYKIKIEELQDIIFSAHHTLSNNEWYNKSIKPRTLEEAVDEARKELDPDYWCTDEESKLDQRVNSLLEHYLEELQSSHCGDCTCFAMSCSKCIAEDRFGINTIKGLGKHPGHYVNGAFSYKDGDEWKTRSIDEALEILKNYKPNAGWLGWKAHEERWKNENKQAYEWLLNYKNTILNNQTN